jgi:hypothetical protein
MATDEPRGDALESLWNGISSLLTILRKISARDVNSGKLRNQTRELVQNYFRIARPELSNFDIEKPDLAQIDAMMQRLLELSNGRNPKSSYVNALKSIHKLRPKVEIAAETSKIKARPTPPNVFTPSRLESNILATLDRLVPTAGLSYRQVLQDLQSPGRTSYRGTAAEVREILREILDHLAPDGDVMNAPGFKLETGRMGPTMRQKAKFILKARGLGDTLLKTSQGAVEIVEDGIAALARSVYDRGSVSTHLGSSRREIATVKTYTDAVLAELLQIHS